MKKYLTLVSLFFILLSHPASLWAAESLTEAVNNLEPVIGSFPPNIKDDKEKEVIKKQYTHIKAKLDKLLVKKPEDQDLLFLRGRFQSMGHNFDYPGAWEGATNDLSGLIKLNPGNIPALLELARLWVDSKPDLASKAENLFRAAQCYQGDQPLEAAQRGIFFALYYQGKILEAFRQSAYLTNTWPQNERYHQLNTMVQGVLAKTKPDFKIGKLDVTKLTMASCNY